MQRGRNGEISQRADRDVAIPCIPKQPGLQHHLGELLDKQGNPIGLADDWLEHFGRQFLAACEIPDHRTGFVAPKSIDLDHRHVRLIEPRWEKLGPKREQEEHRRRLDRFDEPIRCFQSGRVDPMRVLDYEEHRLCACKGLNLTGQGLDREIFLPSRRELKGWIAYLSRDRQSDGLEQWEGTYICDNM